MFREGVVFLAFDHFPDNPIMPGVKMISAMIDCAKQTIFGPKPGLSEACLQSIEKVHFLRQVKPISDLYATALVSILDNSIICVGCDIKQGDEKVAECILNFNGIEAKRSWFADSTLTYTGTETWSAKEQGLPMPPEMMVEAMAQTGIQIVQMHPEHQNKLFIFKGIKSTNFYYPVLPETEIIMDAEFSWTDPGRYGQATCTTKVGDLLVADATVEFTAMKIRERPVRDKAPEPELT
jgi:3-hydroxymyristoyl/3-hydroxydecanoyl-(acyl carrier protein) dehydratase